MKLGRVSLPCWYWACAVILLVPFVAGESPCSCDCCIVSQRPLRDQTELANGQTLDVQCSKVESIGTEGALCSSTCQVANVDFGLGTRGPADYSEYCTNRCKPTTETIGTACTSLTLAETEAVDSPGGAAKSKALAPVSTKKTNWEENILKKHADFKHLQEQAKLMGASEEDIQGMIEAQKYHRKPEGDFFPPTRISYDMRKLVSHRMRAEGGAAIARGNAAAQRLQVNDFLASRNALHTHRASEAVAPIAQTIDVDLRLPETSAVRAAEEARETQKELMEGKFESRRLLHGLKARVVAMLRKDATAAAGAEATAFATLKGLDKPRDWAEVVGFRGSMPYMEAASREMAQVTRHETSAALLLDKARAAQQEAQRLAPRANAMQAAGDTMGSEQQQVIIGSLLGKAAEYEKEAKTEWQKVSELEAGASRWQEDGRVAEEHITAQYRALSTELKTN